MSRPREAVYACGIPQEPLVKPGVIHSLYLLAHLLFFILLIIAPAEVRRGKILQIRPDRSEFSSRGKTFFEFQKCVVDDIIRKEVGRFEQYPVYFLPLPVLPPVGKVRGVYHWTEHVGAPYE